MKKFKKMQNKIKNEKQVYNVKYNSDGAKKYEGELKNGERHGFGI
jgi:hypothetical protein